MSLGKSNDAKLSYSMPALSKVAPRAVLMPPSMRSPECLTKSLFTYQPQPVLAKAGSRLWICWRTGPAARHIHVTSTPRVITKPNRVIGNRLLSSLVDSMAMSKHLSYRFTADFFVMPAFATFATMSSRRPVDVGGCCDSPFDAGPAPHLISSASVSGCFVPHCEQKPAPDSWLALLRAPHLAHSQSLHMRPSPGTILDASFMPSSL
mmetsp:Transcript_39824/g.112540  ORF Transcript_39824/g.112540 Transcript_39824/m.112540 type:complete len:207 (+) Transcript_39824:467-1087(+)